MTEYISRETALNFMTSVTIAPDRINAVMEGMALYAEHIKAIPAADVAPVVHAEWKINADGYYPYCSACKKEPPGRCMTAHCPNCGAMMDGGGHDA